MLRTDHHWTPLGSLVMARRIAEEMNARLGFHLQTDLLDEERFETETFPQILLGERGQRVGAWNTPLDDVTLYFPKYVFKYTSAGGNTGTSYDVVMDLDNLNRFITYLSEKIKFKKSAAGQRALMTNKLRQAIKERDGYTCKYCGASVEKEPNLLLEIDHIVPVSKGGMTTEDNLQTLCWRCNRSKGNKTAE